MVPEGNKFKFGIDFQEAILLFIIHDRFQGYKAITLIEDAYFVLINHAIIFRAIKGYWKKKKRIPSKPLLKESLRDLYETREFAKALLKEDKNNIDLLVDKLYSEVSQDGEEILERVIKWSRYIELKDLVETQDLLDWENYEAFSGKVKKAINKGAELNEDAGMFLVAGARDRIHQRQMGFNVTPTPFWQINRLTNAGGVEMGSLIMIMSKAKRFKTGFKLNWGICELRRRRQGFYADFENGVVAIATRGDQSIMKMSKQAIMDGMEEDAMLKKYRKYKRIKSELVIKRFSPGMSTNNIRPWLDQLIQEYGIDLRYGIIDYPDLMGATTGEKDETHRISQAYLDVKTLANDYKLDYILTASHVTREAEKRMGTKYLSSGVAKAIDKVRHCDMILGLQEDEDEKEDGVMRVEVIDQRDGLPDGNAMFWVDIEKQRAVEFTHEERKDYMEQLGQEESGKKKKAKKESDI